MEAKNNDILGCVFRKLCRGEKMYRRPLLTTGRHQVDIRASVAHFSRSHLSNKFSSVGYRHKLGSM